MIDSIYITQITDKQISLLVKYKFAGTSQLVTIQLGRYNEYVEGKIAFLYTSG